MDVFYGWLAIKKPIVQVGFFRLYEEQTAFIVCELADRKALHAVVLRVHLISNRRRSSIYQANRLAKAQ